MNRILGYSWLGLLNRLLFQWFFIRLAKVIDSDTKKIQKWIIIGFVVPLTGWRTDYIWLWRFNE